MHNAAFMLGVGMGACTHSCERDGGGGRERGGEGIGGLQIYNVKRVKGGGDAAAHMPSVASPVNPGARNECSIIEC